MHNLSNGFEFLKILKISYRKHRICKRLFDIFFAFVGIIIFSLPLFTVGLIIKIVSRGPIIYWSDRVGISNSCFSMAKLRTMKKGTPLLSSNHFNEPDKYFISFGKFFREFGFDELPQLYNILKGDMSFVGPRPVILDDCETLALRKQKGVDNIKPGLTGLAQINGRNSLSVYKKVYYDEIYLQNMNMLLDIKIIFLTIYYIIHETLLGKRQLL